MEEVYKRLVRLFDKSSEKSHAVQLLPAVKVDSLTRLSYISVGDGVRRRPFRERN
jgi:hypothetical protein